MLCSNFLKATFYEIIKVFQYGIKTKHLKKFLVQEIEIKKLKELLATEVKLKEFLVQEIDIKKMFSSNEQAKLDEENAEYKVYLYSIATWTYAVKDLGIKKKGEIIKLWEEIHKRKMKKDEKMAVDLGLKEE